MGTIFRIIGICLGIPDQKFTWCYYDKNKAYHSIGPITPKEFYEEYVRPLFNVDHKVTYLLFCLFYRLELIHILLGVFGD